MFPGRGFVRGIIFIITKMVQCVKHQRYPDESHETDLENVDVGHNSNQIDTTSPTPSSYTRDIPKNLANAIEDYIRFTKVTFTNGYFEDITKNSVKKWKDGAYVHMLHRLRGLTANEPMN